MLRLIVVDDEKDARDKMIKSIDQTKNGITIVGKASDGIEALRLIHELTPDIVLMDIEMPGMSGLDVIQKVRDAGLSVVFIIISSYDEFAYARACIRLDVEDYLLKPFLPADICNSVYRAAERIRSVRLLPYFNSEATTPPSPALLQRAPFKSTNMPLTYPYDKERMLIDSFQFGSDKETYSALHNFFNAVKSSNRDTIAVTNCYIILYVEIFHFVMSQGIDFSSLNMYVPEIATRDIEVFEKTLLSLYDEVLTYLNTDKTSSAVIARAVGYINEHYAEELTLERVASQIYVSPSYLSRSFTHSLSIHFTDYIHNVRIDNAVRLMTEQPHLKIYEIGDMVGYKSVKYFAQVFKSIKGTTVSQFRSRMLSASIISQ